MHQTGGPENLRLEDVERPRPGKGQTLIEVAAAGVTFGDVLLRRGGFGDAMPLPCGLGFDVSGTVVEHGPGGGALPLGSRVAARVRNGYAEYVTADAADVIAVPETVDLQTAAALPIRALVAYQVVETVGALRAGESVLIHAAAGGVGTLAVQFARVLGAGTIIGTTANVAKSGHILAMGADHAVDSSDPSWAEQVRELTGGQGVNLVLDCIGDPLFAQSWECVAPFGRMVTYGTAAGSPGTVSSLSLLGPNRSVEGYSMIGWLQRPEFAHRAISAVMTLLERGEVVVPVGAVFALEKAADAHRAFEERQKAGMILLRP